MINFELYFVMIRTIILLGDGGGKNERRGEGNWEDKREGERKRRMKGRTRVFELPNSNIISQL